MQTSYSVGLTILRDNNGDVRAKQAMADSNG